MPSNEDKLKNIVEMLRPLGDIKHRSMMGEYLLYLDGVLFGGIYDDRFMLKITPCVKHTIPDAPCESPYPGAKAMVVADNIDTSVLLTLIPDICSEIPKKTMKH